MLDILCIGDAKLDIFLLIPQTNPNVSLDKVKNKLNIDFGEKIYIEKYTLANGGNATNTAVGISRLGFKTGLFAEIGKDEFSQKILDNLKEENVNTDFLLQNASEKTSISVGLSYTGERTLFTEHVLRDHNFIFNNISTKLIYLTSLGNVWEKVYEKTLETIKSTNIKLAFNPGTLQLEKRDKLIMDLIEKTDYLFLNKEEAQVLLYGNELELNLKNETENLIKKMLFGLKSLGAKNVIITDSNNGSYLQDENNNTYSLGIVKSEIVEKTGAGDSYTSGFLAAILNDLTQLDGMIWGSVNAASVIGKIGSEDGLLTKIELKEKLTKLSDFNPKKL